MTCSFFKPLNAPPDVDPVVSSTLSATLVRISRINRSRNCLLVNMVPSLPARGDVFTSNVALRVGSSTLSNGRGSGAVQEGFF